MLAQLGLLQFETTGLGPHEWRHATAADYAEKDVVGALKPAEFVGPGDDEITLACCLPGPEMVDRGLGSVALLDRMRLSGAPYILVRGDGTSLGWRRITKCEVKHRRPDGDMIGRVVDFEMTLKLTPRPGPAAALAFLYSLLS